MTVEIKTESKFYYCIYWEQDGGNVMRGRLNDLVPHIERLDSEGIPVRLEAFGYEEV